MTAELGRPPTRVEFCNAVRGAERSIQQEFNNFTTMLQSVGFQTSQGRTPTTGQSSPEKLLKKYRALCAKVEQIQGHTRHVLPLDEMFARAGNPPTLKLSAQPDTHAKFVHRPAFNAYLEFLRYWRPHVHLILGDFVDCEGLSHWPSNDLEPRRIVPEMKSARGLLEEIVAATPEVSTRLFLTGNHEDWINQAFTRMPELFDGLAELDIELSVNSLLGLPKYGYQLFPLNHLVQIGNAHFTHGLYTGTHHAAKHLKQLKATVFYGHCHDDQEHNETSMEGNLHCASLGCLCRLDAKFLKGRPNNWVHNHGVFEFFPDGSYTFFKPGMQNARFAYNGRVFGGAPTP